MVSIAEDLQRVNRADGYFSGLTFMIHAHHEQNPGVLDVLESQGYDLGDLRLELKKGEFPYICLPRAENLPKIQERNGKYYISLKKGFLESTPFYECPSKEWAEEFCSKWKSRSRPGTFDSTCYLEVVSPVTDPPPGRASAAHVESIRLYLDFLGLPSISTRDWFIGDPNTPQVGDKLFYSQRGKEWEVIQHGDGELLLHSSAFNQSVWVERRGEAWGCNSHYGRWSQQCDQPFVLRHIEDIKRDMENALSSQNPQNSAEELIQEAALYFYLAEGWHPRLKNGETISDSFRKEVRRLIFNLSNLNTGAESQEAEIKVTVERSLDWLVQSQVVSQSDLIGGFQTETVVDPSGVSYNGVVVAVVSDISVEGVLFYYVAPMPLKFQGTYANGGFIGRSPNELNAGKWLYFKELPFHWQARAEAENLITIDVAAAV